MTTTAEHYTTTAAREADAAYDAIRDQHGEDYAAQWPTNPDGTVDLDSPRVVRCICGYTPRQDGKSPKRSRGLHLAAMKKRADQAWNAAYDAAIEAARVDRYQWS